MNITLPACLAFTFREEGGYTVDVGGPTNLGITQTTLCGWRGCPVTIHDVQTLSRAEATAIYTAHYWRASGCDGLPSGLDLMVFDEAVNAGVGVSARLLQHILGVIEDGNIGPATLRAAECSGAVLGSRIEALGRAQLARYHALAGFAVSGRGWTARVAARVAAAKSLAFHQPVGAAA